MMILKKYSGTLSGIFTLLIALAIGTGIAVSDRSAYAQTPPLPPHSFLGEVTVDGSPAGSSLGVQARLDDNVNYTPGNPTTNSQGQYGTENNSTDFIVCGDTGIEGRQGGNNGDVITFFVRVDASWYQADTFDVDGEAIDEVLFARASTDRVDLRVDTSTEPAGNPDPSSVACTVGDEIDTPTPTPGSGGPGGGGGSDRDTRTPTPTNTSTPTQTGTPEIGLDDLSLEQAITIISNSTPQDAARRLEETSPRRAADILDQVGDSHVEDIIEEIDPDALTLVLVLMSENKVKGLNPQVIFQALPQIPARLLLPDDPPEADPNFDDPVAVQVSDTLVIYQVPSTGELVWVYIVRTPAPIEEILAKFSTVITDVQVEVEDLTETPSGSPDFGADEIINSLFRIDVENADPTDLVAGYATIYLSKSWMEENEIHPMSVKLNRLDEESNTWVPLPARRVRENNDQVFYTVAVPGFSVYAITGSDEPQTIPFTVQNLQISPDSPAENEDIEISVDITNIGDDFGIYPADLFIDNVLEDSEFVPVAAGDTETVTFTIRRPEGVYGIRIERIIDQLVVGQPAPTPTPTSSPTATNTPTAVPADTPAPTNTPTTVPTDTPVPTNTPTIVPTDTPVPTNTPTVVPTDTPVPTNTPVTPPTPTATPEPPPSDGGNLGLIIGIIVGAVIIIAAGIALFAIFRRRNP
jgi:PGF-pre-PGF domain-containing protein